MNLKIEFEKWTIAVENMAIFKGKKSKKMGNKIVPKPKPEKNVKIEPNVTTKSIKMIFILVNQLIINLFFIYLKIY